MNVSKKKNAASRLSLKWCGVGLSWDRLMYRLVVYSHSVVTSTEKEYEKFGTCQACPFTFSTGEVYRFHRVERQFARVRVAIRASTRETLIRDFAFQYRCLHSCT